MTNINGKSPGTARMTEKMLLIGIWLAASFWLIESAVHVFIFEEGDLIQQVFSPQRHEIWMRLIVVAMFVAFAIYAQFIVTARKKAEEASEVAYSELNQIFSTAADGMRVVDKDFNVLRVNETFSTLSGISNDEAAGKKCYEIFRGPLCHTPDCPLVRILSGEKRVEFDVDKMRNDGVTVPCIVVATPFIGSRGELVGIVEDFKDITDRKYAEKALYESEERYRSLVENIDLGITLIDRNHTVMMTNKAQGRMFKKPVSEFVGKKCYREFEKRETVCSHCPGSTAMAIGKPAKVETEGVQDDGSRFAVSVHAFPLFGTDGKSAGFIEVVENITEVRDAQEEKERLENQLQQAQKLEAIGTLAGGIAHDFNNVLMSIQGHASLALVYAESGRPHSEHLRGIQDSVQRGADLSKQLLSFAKGGKFEVKPTDLNELIEGSSEMFGRTKKEIRIHKKYQKGIWPVEVDQGQVEQVLLNLYVNAWQAMPGGGDLYLQTGNVSLDENRAKPFGVAPGRYVNISVTDTGVGMDRATQQRIFDPFFTTKEMGRGSGLGLASAYGIIKSHHGTISVHSKKGKGTTFHIHLPASEKEIPIKEKGPDEEVLKGTETVLLVDDEDIILAVGKDMLKEMGYNVLLARGGREAIEVYKKHKNKIDLVILDMIMPDISGGEVYDKMKETNPKVKTLLASGYSISGHANKILKRGCDGFIQKPFDMNQLSRKIREILG